MKNKILLWVIFLASFAHFSCQKIHIRYKNVRSPIVTIYEDLYINEKNEAISIQDSIFMYAPSPSSEINILSRPRSNSAPSKIKYISDIGNKEQRNFFFNSYIGNSKYFVFDVVSKPNWKINDKDTKRIAGYDCIYAETTFRGSEIEAYFAKNLPFNCGPFKFFGLPGLILYVKEKGISYNIWRAESINKKEENTSIIFKPSYPELEKITIQEFVRLRDMKFKEGNSKPNISNTKIQTFSQKQMSIEKKYEWEDN